MFGVSLGRAGQPLNFRVAAPARFFEGAEDLVYFSSDDLDSFSRTGGLGFE
jgi:hypothetical protein